MNNQLPPSKVILNSEFASTLRDNGSTAIFNLETGGVDLDGNTAVCKVSARSFSAINNIYNINDTCNTLQLAYYDTSSGFKITTVTITNGAYDIFDLVSTLKTSLQDAYDAGGNIALYVPTYNELTGKVTFTATFSAIATTLYGFYIIATTYTSLLKKLGFDLTKKVSLLSMYTGYESLVTVTNTSPSITTGNLPNLYYPRMLYICIDEIRTTNRVALPLNEFGIVLTEFAVNCSFGDYMYSEPNTFSYHVPNLKTDTFTVRIMDEFGEAIDWNGGFWTLVLGLEYGTTSLNEDPTLGRTFRPLLNKTVHDPLHTSHERIAKRKFY